MQTFNYFQASSLTNRTARTCRHQISMQTHLQASGAPNTSTRQFLEGRASSTAQQHADDGAGAEDEASDGAGDASPSPSNAGHSDVDGKRRMSQDGTAAPRENGEQAPAELSGRKARVSVRARSEAPMVIILT